MPLNERKTADLVWSFVYVLWWLHSKRCIHAMRYGYLIALIMLFLLQATNTGDKTNIRLQSPRLEGALSGCVMDACVPFPRTSGARFNHVGILVTFSQVINSKGISLKHQNTTPRFGLLNDRQSSFDCSFLPLEHFQLWVVDTSVM